MKALRPFFLCALVTVSGLVSLEGSWIADRPLARAQNQQVQLVQQDQLESKKIVPFVPTPQDIVERMLELAEVKPGDVVYDLGSGDGRIVITAAKKYGVKATGFEIDPELIARSRESIKREGLQHLAEIRDQDIRTVDLSPATVLTMYLLPDVNLMLRPNIQKQLRPGSRVVSHDFSMGDWKPDVEQTVQAKNGGSHKLYVWRIR